MIAINRNNYNPYFLGKEVMITETARGSLIYANGPEDEEWDDWHTEDDDSELEHDNDDSDMWDDSDVIDEEED